jgi:hypothetical protein
MKVLNTGTRRVCEKAHTSTRWVCEKGHTSTTLIYTESTLRKSSEFVVAHSNLITAMVFSD